MMKVNQIYVSERLVLNPMKIKDAPFVLQLLNSPGWIEFIGDRKVSDIEGAVRYIESFDNNPEAFFWVVTAQSTQESLGVVSLIQRTYLPYPDIGFAFLPEYAKQGFAFEAANCVLRNIEKEGHYKVILGTTLNSNVNSQRLLERLGLVYVENISVDKEDMMLYSSDKNRSAIDLLIENFYAFFKNSQTDWDRIAYFFTPDATITEISSASRRGLDMKQFMEPQKKLLTQGGLTDFSEIEVQQQTQIEGLIAHRFSTYKKNGMKTGKIYMGQGKKSFQLIQTNRGWKIHSLIWEDEIMTPEDLCE